MAPTDHGDAVLVALESGETYRIQVVRRPLPRGSGVALFYRCPWCRKPRRHLYLLSLSGAKLVEYLGLRCQVCAGSSSTRGGATALASGLAFSDRSVEDTASAF